MNRNIICQKQYRKWVEIITIVIKIITVICLIGGIIAALTGKPFASIAGLVLGAISIFISLHSELPESPPPKESTATTPISTPTPKICKGKQFTTIVSFVLAVIGIFLTIYFGLQESSPPKESIVTPTPTLTLILIGHPNVADLEGCNENLVHPDAENWLQGYETKYVKSTRGNCIYLRYGPSLDYDYFKKINDNVEVTVLARQNGFSLVKVTDGVAGWARSELLVDEYSG